MIIEKVVVGAYSITFVGIDGHRVRIELQGDCCSRSFFDDYSIIDARGLIGNKLLGIESVGRKTPDEDPYLSSSEDTKYYALIVRTDKQSVTLDWRNESNGYYSGYAEFFVDDERCGSWGSDKELQEFLDGYPK